MSNQSFTNVGGASTASDEHHKLIPVKQEPVIMEEKKEPLSEDFDS